MHPFGAWGISLVNPLLRISARESHLMVRFAPMGGARCQRVPILHVEPTQPAYIPIRVLFGQVQLEWGIHPCSCWGYKCPWGGTYKWGNTSISSRCLVCECSASAPSSMTACATSSTSSTLAASAALPRVEHALGRSRKMLLPHVLDRGDVKLRVWGGGGVPQTSSPPSVVGWPPGLPQAG